MPKVGIDFSVVAYESYTFTSPHGKAYVLRDDVPLEIIIQSMAAISKLSEVAGNATTIDSADGVISVIQQAQQGILAAFTILVKHSLPTITAEELSAQFTMEQQVSVIRFFNQVAGNRWQSTPEPISETTATSLATMPN